MSLLLIIIGIIARWKMVGYLKNYEMSMHVLGPSYIKISSPLKACN